MPRPSHRLVSFVLLVSTLLSLLPVAQPAPPVTAAPLAVEAHDPAPRIPRPTDAGSSSLPETSASTMRDLHGETHTTSGAVDGTYGQESIATHTYAGTRTGSTIQYEGSSNQYTEVTHTVPGGPYTHDALTFNYTVPFTGTSLSTIISVRLSVKNPTTGEWGEELLVQNATFRSADKIPGSSPSQYTRTLSETDVHVSLGIVPLRAPVEIRFRCVNDNATVAGGVGSCQISNLRFANNVPNWSRYGVFKSPTTTIEQPSRRWEFKVGRTAVAGPIVGESPFLSIKTDHPNAGAPTTSRFVYRSPLIKLPPAADTSKFTASVRYAHYLDAPGGTLTSTTDIKFMAINTAGPITLISIPAVNTSTTIWNSQVTQNKDNIDFDTKDLAGKTGWIQVEKSVGSIDHVVALDNIQIYLDGKPIALPADQLLGKCACDESGRAQHVVGDPVNSFSGSYYLQATDLTAPSSGPPLSFERSYASMFANPSLYRVTPLGTGWQHPFAEQLVLSGSLSGEANTIIYEAATGNRLRFYIDSQGVPHAAPGVRATLDKQVDPHYQQPVYVLRSSEQWLKIFDLNGRLLERRDPTGRRQTLSYYNAPGQIAHGQLEQVTDLTSGYALRFTYIDRNGARLSAVAQVPDATTSQQKIVSFGYRNDGALETVTDLHGGTTTYAYKTGTFLLESIHDTLNTRLILNTYDHTTQQVTQQVSQTGVTTTYEYGTAANGGRKTTVRQWPGSSVGPAQDILIDYYRPEGTLEYQTRQNPHTDQEIFQSYTTFDGSLAPAARVDGRGNTTRTVNNGFGMPISITDSLNQTTALRYDAYNRPLELTAPDGKRTTLAYDAAGNMIRSTVRGQDALQLTSIYTYTVNNQLQAKRQPDGVVTSYAYNTRSQLLRTIVNEQSSGFDAEHPDKHLVTEYGYDAFGRLITTTVGVGTSLARIDTTSYNADDTIARTIQNYKDGVFNPSQPDEDLITEYGYDRLGRHIFVKNVLGHYDATHYDSLGRIDWTTRNFDPALFTLVNGVPTLAPTLAPPAFDPAHPDRNIVTRYAYDALNRTTNVTETGILTGTFDPTTQQFSAATERATRIEYDQFSRPVTVTLNYQPGQPNYDPAQGTGNPQINLQELTYYDGASNVSWQRDVFGRWTKTEYDALNRPVRTIANYENGNPTTIDPANTGWATGSDTDLITEQQYRADGQLAQQIANRISGAFSLSNPDRDRITEYTYDVLGRPTTTIANILAGSTRTDINRVSGMAYDPQTGRVLGQKDGLGQWLSYRYDALSRVTETIQNCRTTLDGSSHPNDCTDTTKPSERNVRSLTRYDALGRVVETEDALGHVRHTDYNGLGRVVATTANYVENVAPDVDTNVTTRTEYDALGRVVAVTDPTGSVTRTEYDALGHAVAVTDAAGRVTRNGYDATGALRWTQRHDGRLTVFQVDGLGRVVTTIANYHNGVIEAADGVDRDIITTTSYDVAGRTIETIETARQIAPSAPGRRTAFRYDLRDQLIQVIENYHSQCSTLPAAQQPCNVISTYTYDRAGNRTAITDALSHTRQMDYDAADRLIEDRDALNRATGWEYNERDQPTRKRDPRGSAYDVTYTYDELGRRTGTSAPQLDAPIAEQYDVLGRRTQLQDGTGTTSFQYDDLSRVTRVQQPGGTVGYRYTARGERSELQYPSGATVAYTYTAGGQLDTVYEGATALAHYAYDGVGRLAHVTRANGALTTYAYDGLDRLFDLTTRVQGELRSRYQYTLDRTGLRTAVTETFPPTTSVQSVLMQSSTESSTVEPSTVRGLAPLAFVPNRGQTDRRVAFVARHQGGTVFLTRQDITLSLPVAAPEDAQSVRNDAAGTNARRPRDQRQTAVRVEWVRANPSPTLTPDQSLSGTVSDLRGSTPTSWQRNLPTYSGVTYTGLYDGIDLHYDGTQGTLKGTYTVAPGADPKQIRWRYAGGKSVQITDGGDLQVRLAAPADHAAPTLTEATPVAWQDGPSGRRPVTVAYRVDQDGSVGFVLGTYDAARPLTIDPTLTWSTTLSGSGSEEGHGIAVASDGALVVTGATNSANFPQNPGVQPVGHHGNFDAFVTKLSADGTQVLWQTFLGGSGHDYGQSLALDALARPVIVGMTASANLPTTSNAVQLSFGAGTCAGVPCFDAFIARLSADGSTLQYSSYLGGSNRDWAQRVALASDGSAVLVGETASASFPTTSGAWQTVSGNTTCAPGPRCTDAFITRIDPSATTSAQALRWSTRLGGVGGDSAWGVAIDGVGDVLVAGETESANLPLANAYDPSFGGLSDAFVAKLNGDGTTLHWGTYLGSTAADVGRDVAVDGAGDVYVTGWTSSLGFPTTPGALQSGLAGANDAFVTRLSGDGTQLRWSTLVGGSHDDYSTSFTVAADGTSTLVGSTASVDLPTVRPFQTSHAGPSDGQDLLVATLKPDGSTAHLVSSLGSSSDDRAWDVAAAGSGSVRITGYTGAASFPGGSPPPGGTSNGLVVALDGLTTPGGEPTVEQRMVSYRYDPLQRLTEATETPGTSERYSYDLVGNRTQIWVNGAPQPARTYDAAHQVVGGSYDAAGNLLYDGTRTLTYDALNRLTSAGASGTTYRYNGDGVLASQTANSATTSYTQDLIGPLSQVLERSMNGTTTTYRYGQERLAEVQSSTRTWYGTDALGSVRQTLTDSGSASTPIHYDPWGTPKQAPPLTFGFTGELQDVVSGLIHLRARWYLPGQGAFASRDPFAGFPKQPYSLHPYQYGYSNPVLYTDPSGLCPPTVGSNGCDTPVTLAGFGARMLGIIEQWNYDSTSHHTANRPSATITVYRFLDRHSDLAQRYDPRTDPTLRQDIQKYFRDRDYDETVAHLLGILGGWRIDNPPAHESGSSIGWGALGMIAFALPIDISDCLPFGGNQESVPPVNRSPQASFDDRTPSRSRMHHGNGGGGGGSSLVIGSRSPADIAGNTKYLPTDIKVSRRKVESWAKMMKDGTFPWDQVDEPIEITIAPNGTFITDGHNRFLATQVAGLKFPEDLPPGAVVTVRESKPFPQPYQRDPWSGIWQWSNLRWEP